VAVSIQELLRCLHQQLGHERFARLIESEVRAAALAQGFSNLDTYLDHYGARSLYRRCGLMQGDRTADIEKLSRAMGLLRLPLIEFRPPPWSQWIAGSTIEVVLGERHAMIDEISTIKQRVVGARDVEALARLVNVLQTELRLEFRIGLHVLKPGLGDAEATVRLRDLRRSDAGAIVVLGSPIVNPIAEPVARAMLDDPSRGLPARFRWAFPNAPVGLLSERVANSNEEGIRCLWPTEDFFPRIRDDEMFDQAGSSKQGTFPDCGILMADFRARPFLILAAGHGGWGTIAAILALGRLYRWHRDNREGEGDLLDHERESAIGPNRLFEVVLVKRRKKTANPVDDLELQDWGFAWR
jgi:hypothetical protein